MALTGQRRSSAENVLSPQRWKCSAFPQKDNGVWQAHSASAGNLRRCWIQPSVQCGSDLGFTAEEGLYSQCRPDNRRGAFGCSQQDLRHLVSQSDAFRLCKQAGMSAY